MIENVAHAHMLIWVILTLHSVALIGLASIITMDKIRHWRNKKRIIEWTAEIRQERAEWDES